MISETKIYHISCFTFAAECAEGSDTISVDSSTKPKTFHFSVLDGIKDSPNPDDIENDSTKKKKKKNLVTVSFENLKPETNIAKYLYFEGSIHSKKKKKILLQCTFKTDRGTFKTDVSSYYFHIYHKTSYHTLPH